MQQSAADARRRPLRPTYRLTWPRAAVILGLLVAAFVVSKSCQQSQIRITKDQAIGIAERQVDFKPTKVQVRLVRQGLTAHAFWAVSLSVPSQKRQSLSNDKYAKLTVVKIDANKGKVEEVFRQQPSKQKATKKR